MSQRSHTPISHPLALLVAAACALGACSEEALNPVSVNSPADPDGGTPPLGDAGDAGAGGGTLEDGGKPPRRTLEKRNPFGNVAEAENLLWDGDFEWVSPFSDQYGWLKGLPLQYAFDGTRIGTVCRSGIKCAALEPGKVLVAVGVASRGFQLEASIWVRPAQPGCSDVVVELISGVLDAPGTPDEPEVSLTPETPGPDGAGWCRYAGIADERSAKPFLFIKNNSGGDIILDDAVLKRVPPSTAIVASPKSAQAKANPADLAAVRADLARLRVPHDAPPNAARRALETWKNKP